MIEGKLSVKLIMNLVSPNVSEFICDVVTSFEGVGKVISFDKVSESSAYLRVGSVDLILTGGSGGVVRAELFIDSCDFMDDFSGFVNVFKRLLGQKLMKTTMIRSVELLSTYESYIPLTKPLKHEPGRISKALSSYGILVHGINSEVLEGVEVFSVSGTYVVSGMGAVRVYHSALMRNYAVRTSLTMSKVVKTSELNEEVIKRLTYESQILAHLINDELYFKSLR